ARSLTSFNCAVTSLILANAASAPVLSVMPGKVDFKAAIDELNLLGRLTPSTFKSAAAMPTVPVAGRDAAGSSATFCSPSRWNPCQGRANSRYEPPGQYGHCELRVVVL